MAQKQIRSFWRTLLRLNRGYGGANNAAHGALRFGSIVKAVGWLGLLAIVFLLLHKMHEIQAQLDPVNHSLLELQLELVQAQQVVGKDTQASTDELQRLRDRAAALGRALDKTSGEHLAKEAESLTQSEAKSEALAKQLDADAQQVAMLDTQVAEMKKALADNQRAVAVQAQLIASQNAALADGGAAVLAALAGLQQSEAATDAQLRSQAALVRDGGAAALAALAAVRQSGTAAEAQIRAQTATLAQQAAAVQQRTIKGAAEHSPIPAVSTP